jgi:hypothetical protein
VGSSATLGTGSFFKGNILALTSITVTTGVMIDGRVLARNGAVTLDTNTITKADCAVSHLSITVPGSANLGSAALGGTISGHLGTVTVDASGVNSWTATASATDFTSGGGSPAQTIPKSNVSQWSGPVTAQTGSGTATPGQATAAQAQNLSTTRTAFSLQSGGPVTADLESDADHLGACLRAGRYLQRNRHALGPVVAASPRAAHLRHRPGRWGRARGRGPSWTLDSD